MWIQLTCPNGHPVKVEDKYAGRVGRCPACSAKVPIPEPNKSDISEDAILDILGPAEVAAPHAPEPLPVHQEGGSDTHSGGSSIASSAAVLQQPMKICPACKRRVSVRYQICPHCRTYMPIQEIAEVTPKAAMNCPHCGATSYPGAKVCGNCGEMIR